jgi:hypothetical protein
VFLSLGKVCPNLRTTAISFRTGNVAEVKPTRTREDIQPAVYVATVPSLMIQTSDRPLASCFTEAKEKTGREYQAHQFAAESDRVAHECGEAKGWEN